VLQKAGIILIGDLVIQGVEQFRNVKGVGDKRITEIRISLMRLYDEYYDDGVPLELATPDLESDLLDLELDQATINAWKKYKAGEVTVEDVEHASGTQYDSTVRSFKNFLGAPRSERAKHKESVVSLLSEEGWDCDDPNEIRRELAKVQLQIQLEGLLLGYRKLVPLLDPEARTFIKQRLGFSEDSELVNHMRRSSQTRFELRREVLLKLLEDVKTRA
jgi:hypothetical protein